MEVVKLIIFYDIVLHMTDPFSIAGVAKILGTGILTGAGAEVGKGALRKLGSVFDDKPYTAASEFIRACESAGGRVEYQDRGRETIVTCYFEKSDSPDL